MGFSLLFGNTCEITAPNPNNEASQAKVTSKLALECTKTSADIKQSFSC